VRLVLSQVRLALSVVVRPVVPAPPVLVRQRAAVFLHQSHFLVIQLVFLDSRLAVAVDVEQQGVPESVPAVLVLVLVEEAVALASRFELFKFVQLFLVLALQVHPPRRVFEHLHHATRHRFFPELVIVQFVVFSVHLVVVVSCVI
jgi:hypothetical protein